MRHFSSHAAHESNDPFASIVISPQQLFAALKAEENGISLPRVVPLSSAWFMPNDPQGRTGHGSFLKHRIPASHFFDLDVVCDQQSPWPHMLPSAGHFATCMRSLGIKRSDCVVFYDTPELGLFSAPRAAWTLKHFGHPQVHVLNNFKVWMEQGFPTESGHAVPPEAEKYELPPNEIRQLSVDREKVESAIRSNLGSGSDETTVILDARPFARFSGLAPEPRPGLPSGHMPTSASLPFTELLDPKTKALLPRRELEKILDSKVSDRANNVISTCGTGVSASIVDLAFEVVEWPSSERRRLYDGSWTEWASVHKSSQDGWIETS